MGDLFKALSDNTRRKILQYLLEEGEKSAGDIVAKFNVSGATISHHLSTLKEADLVTTQRHGKSILYSANATIIEEMITKIYGYLGDKRKSE